jgi:hypothetical protein
VVSKEDKEAVFLSNGANTVVRHLANGETVWLIGVDTPDMNPRNSIGMLCKW